MEGETKCGEKGVVLARKLVAHFSRVVGFVSGIFLGDAEEE